MSIHARLNNTIRKSGGYSRVDAAKELRWLYDIDFNIAYELAKKENIFKDIHRENLNEFIENAKRNILINKIRLNSLLSIL